jgi:hypothetical protein
MKTLVGERLLSQLRLFLGLVGSNGLRNLSLAHCFRLLRLAHSLLKPGMLGRSDLLFVKKNITTMCRHATVYTRCSVRPHARSLMLYFGRVKPSRHLLDECSHDYSSKTDASKKKANVDLL